MSVTSNQTPTICGAILRKNISNGTVVDIDTSELLAPLDKLVSGALIFFIVLPFVLLNFRFFPIGSTPALLVGSAFMVFAHVLSQDDVYQIVGKQDSLTFIYLVVGLMLITQFFEREQLLTTLLRYILKSHLTFENYVWRVALLSFLLSAVFSSDACGAILTPLLLKFWEVQERQEMELETLVLAITTSANIGSATTIFGSAHIALLASKTTSLPLARSALDLRHCLLYLCPAAVLAFLINLGFLIGHYRIRSRDIQKSKLICEASTSEQEMSGLTRTHGSGNLTKLNGTMMPSNGVLRYNGGEEITFEEEDSDSIQEDRLSLPCQLETIPEDEVLEITSSRSASVLDNDAISSNTPEHGYITMENEESSNLNGGGNSSSDEEESRNTVHALSTCDAMLEESNSLTMDIEYRPSALQSQDPSSFRSGAVGVGLGGGGTIATVTTPTKSLEKQGLKLSDRFAIYRSMSVVSAIGFLPIRSGDSTTDVTCQEEPFPSSDSKLFQAFVSFMLVVVIALNLASTSDAVIFDIGLVPLGAAILIITADAMLNRQSASITLKRCDWSVVIMFMAIFVWMSGFNATGLPKWTWHHLGLSNVSGNLDILQVVSIAGLCILGTNLFGPFLFILTILELLQPCQNQLQFILCVAWCSSIGCNLTLCGSVSNIIVAHRARETVDFRLTNWIYLRFAIITTLIHIITGLCLIFGILHIVAKIS